MSAVLSRDALLGSDRVPSDLLMVVVSACAVPTWIRTY